MNEDQIYALEQEPAPVWRSDLRYKAIRSILAEDEYKALNRCFLLPDHGARQIQPNIVYFDSDKKQIKFLLLKKALIHPYQRALNVLKNAKWGTATRESAKGQPNARKITYGYYPQLPGHQAVNSWYSVRNEATLTQPALAAGLRPLVKAMDACVREYLPPYYENAFNTAMTATQRIQEDDWSKVPTTPAGLDLPDSLSLVKNIDPWALTPELSIYSLWGTIFSTLELNKSIIFSAHEDGRNVNGALIAITALGVSVGGRLVFPRYGYSAELEPTDLLICDNNKELHGNLGPLVGERYSVVAFLHTNVLDYAHKEGHWRK